MTADWILIPCLRALFAEFDRIAPSRDHASDGSIGDTAHQNEVSDHNPDETGSVPIHDADSVNEVHAIDVDNDLNRSDLTMESVVQHLLARCRSGAEKRLRYIIYDRRIWSASSGWVQKTYTGASPHTEHAHFSASYETALEASTASWNLVQQFGDDMSVQDVVDGNAQYDAVTGAAGAHRNSTGVAVWDNQDIPNAKRGARTPAYTLFNDLYADLLLVKQAVAELAGKDFTDEQAIVQGVLAGLGPAAMTDAMVAALQALPAETARLVLDEMSKRLAPAE